MSSAENHRKFEMRQAYRRTFTSPEGIKVLEDLEARTAFHDSNAEQWAAQNPYAAAFADGRRSVVVAINLAMNAPQTPQEEAELAATRQRNVKTRKERADG